MKKIVITLFPVLFFACTAYAQLGKHIPKTFIHENWANQVLKGEKPREVLSMAAGCASDSHIDGIDLGDEIELGSHDEVDLPDYVKSYNNGLKELKSRIEIWDTVIKGTSAYIKYCYYKDNPEKNFIVIYMQTKKKEK
ncbi:hypothetical protein L0222_02060 [bacterium]|nr:hypothetical protein [bacterium]MCI0604298.1 hypothetical protein [bacterium]